jgi:hypothetical protein
MLMFVTVVALVVALIVFLNVLPSSRNTTQSLSSVPDRVNPATVYRNQKKTSGPLPRICPVCGSVLSQTEYLLAAIEEPREGRKRQAQIYGCPHCFITDGVNLNLGKMEPPA